MASKKKLLTSGIALTLAAAIGLGGTFAWQSINQTALNEASDIVNPGGRLHNDQHWVSDLVNDTDIYVENFTDPDNGGNDIFARVRLEEYMEVVMNYGVAGAETVEVIAGSKTPVEGSTYTADNATHKNEFTYTYAVHKFTDDDKTKDFWKWTAGDEDSENAYFIPTYNLNKDSLLADLNGEYVDTLGGISNREDAQYTYTKVESDTKGSGYEVYDGDVNTLDEVKMADLKDLIANGTDAENYNTYKDNIVLTDAKVDHNAAKIGTSNGLISMEEWLELLGDDEYDADTHGNYWVYDTDGWVYWSSPIKAGTSTGRLLDSISLNGVMDDTWYYAINVVAQFVTANDVGKTTGDGFYSDLDEDPSEDAETLLKNIGVDMSGDRALPKVEAVVFTEMNRSGNVVGTYDTEATLYPEDYYTLVPHFFAEKKDSLDDYDMDDAYTGASEQALLDAITYTTVSGPTAYAGNSVSWNCGGVQKNDEYSKNPGSMRVDVNSECYEDFYIRWNVGRATGILTVKPNLKYYAQGVIKMNKEGTSYTLPVDYGVRYLFIDADHDENVQGMKWAFYQDAAWVFQHISVTKDGSPLTLDDTGMTEDNDQLLYFMSNPHFLQLYSFHAGVYEITVTLDNGNSYKTTVTLTSPY